MLLNKVIPSAKKYFPKLEIKFKNNSFLMKLLGILLFFNKSFLSSFTTTIGSSIYFPNKQFLQEREWFSFVTLMHELVHVYDSNKNPLFKFLYLFPQILAPFISLLFFVLSWKIVLPLVIIALLPLPAYFRSKYEKRGYFVSLYVIYHLSKRWKDYTMLNFYKEKYIKHFKGADYYFMSPFGNVEKEFDDMVSKIKSGGKPLDGELMVILDNLIHKFFYEE